MSLELINVLSALLWEANQRIAELARTLPENLQALYDDSAEISGTGRPA